MALLEKKTIELASGLSLHIDPNSEFLQMKVGKDFYTVKKTEFYGVCFLMADPDTQARLMPVRQTEMMTYERIHNVEVTRDIHKGQRLRVRCEVNVPLTVVEGLAGNVKLTPQRNSSGIIL